MIRAYGPFLGLNAILVLLIAMARFDPGPGGAIEKADLARSIVSRWLPFALAVASVLAVLLARCSTDGRRILTRHFWLYLAVPATTALLFFGYKLDQSVLGTPYLAVVATIAAGGLQAIWRSRAVRSDRAIGLLLGAVTLGTALALLPFDRTIQLTESDEPHYLVIMDSLVGDHDLDLKNNYDEPAYFDYYPEKLPDRHIIVAGPKHLPIRDLGLPLIGALPFAIARRTGVMLLMCLAGAAFAWRGYAFLRLHAFSRHAAIAAAGGVALLHPVFTYTTQIYPDLLVALAALVVADLLSRPVTAGRLALASATLGLMPWLTVRAWFIVVGMGLVVAWLALAPLARGITRDRIRRAAAAGAPFVTFILILVALDYALFRVAVPNAGYYLIRGQQTVLAFTPQIGIPGLFLDRTFGLVSRAPLFVLAFFGAVPLLRRARRLRSPGLLALFLGWLLYLVYIGNVQYWWADGSPSSRYQLGTIALPLIAVAAGIDRLRGAIAIALAWAAGIGSAIVTFMFALIPSVRYDIAADIADATHSGRLWIHVTQALRFDPGLLFPSLVRAAPTDAVLTLLWLLLLTGLVILGARPPANPRPVARLR